MAGDPSSVRASQLQAMPQRVFSRGNDDPPYPVYVNGVEFAGMGLDMFMDVGVVSPEAVGSAIQTESAKGEIPVVPFLVNFRFVMSFQTAIAMQVKLTELLRQSSDRIKESIQADVEITAT
jgi:hypothetical protein